MKVAVITDSGSGMTFAQGEDTQIFVLPLQIVINGEIKLEGETISVDEIYEHLMANDDILTLSPPTNRIISLFSKLKSENYDLIFAVPISSGLSSTLNLLKGVAIDIGIAFDYVDCFSTFSNQLYLSQVARIMFDDERGVEEVKEALQSSINDSVTIIIPRDLIRLSTGGNLTSIAATIGNVLKIKSVLYLNKDTLGKIDSLDRMHSMSKAYNFIMKYFKKRVIDEDYLITIGHVSNDEDGKILYNLVKKHFPKCEILYSKLGAVVSVHTGINCIGIQYIKRIKMM